MEVKDLAGLRAIEQKVTGKKVVPPPHPVHHKATAHASQHPLPHGPGITAPKVLKKKQVKKEDVGDRLLGYIQHVNRVHG